MLPALIPTLAPILNKVIGNFFPDKEQKQKVEAEIMKALADHEQELKLAAADIVKIEAASKHWLAANWRPMIMIGLFLLVAARWFGLSAPNLGQEEYVLLFKILEYGLTGYIACRTAEKIMPDAIGKIFNNKRKQE